MTFQKLLNSIFSQIKIHFSIHKKVQFGKAIYVSGNLIEIGNWQIQKSLRLQWNQDDYWSGTVIIPAYLYQTFTFKYLIADYKNPQQNLVEWQHGSNRKITVENQKRYIICNHKWNKQKVTLNLCLERGQNKDQYFVVGNISQLGRWKINNKMKKQILKSSRQHMKQNINFEKQLDTLAEYKQIHSYTFYIYKGRESFQYLFIKKSDKIQSQRYPGRIFIHQKQNNCQNRIRTEYKNGNIQIYDKNSFNQLRMSNITQNIFVGSYLKNSQDIELLRKKGITDILSIQTQQDYYSHNLSVEYMQSICNKQGIRYYSSDIKDKNPRDFVQKSLKTFLKMQTILKNNGKIYVHCSAGMYRSPQIIALYLILVQQYSIQSAIQTIKQKHPFAKPSYIVICSAVDQILCRYYKGTKNVSF